jgi:thymidylate synthase (FAD)
MTEVLFTEIEKANYEAIKARTNESANKLLGLYFPVLDHGFVSLVDYMGSDAEVARAARCSYGAGTRAISDDRALIRYLVRHKHTSPLEQVEFKLHCKMPIFVARQWVRHRTASLNEMSGRYSIMPLQFYSPKFEDFKLQAKDNKQGRDREVERNVYIENRIRSDTARALVTENYEIDLGNDVARELARIDLPLSTYTEWYWKMDLNNLMRFMYLRSDSHAQFEIRAFSDVIAGIVQEVAPASYEAWLDYMFTGAEFSHQEMKALLALGNELGGCGSDLGGGFEEVIPPEDQWTEWGKLFGLSKREVAEFFGKLKLKERPNYKLDLSKAKSPEYYQKEAEKYVPKI